MATWKMDFLPKFLSQRATLATDVSAFAAYQRYGIVIGIVLLCVCFKDKIGQEKQHTAKIAATQLRLNPDHCAHQEVQNWQHENATHCGYASLVPWLAALFLG